MLYKIFVGLCAFLTIGSTGFSGGLPEDRFIKPEEKPAPPIKIRIPEKKIPSVSGPADWIYKASDWVLDLYIIGKENQKQGSHGILIFEGEKVQGSLGETKALPIGRVQYQGHIHSRKNAWDNSGWQMKDPLVQPIVQTPKEPHQDTEISQ